MHGSLKKQQEEMLLGERHQVSAAEAAILLFFRTRTRPPTQPSAVLDWQWSRAQVRVPFH